MSLTKRFAKILTGNKNIRDPLGIFNMVARDLMRILPGVKFYAVGSRVRSKGVKNDFDLMVIGFSEAAFFEGELITDSMKLFVEANKRLYAPEKSDRTQKVIAVIRHRILPVMEKRWTTYKDEYGNPVHVDVMFSDGPPPDRAVEIETS